MQYTKSQVKASTFQFKPVHKSSVSLLSHCMSIRTESNKSSHSERQCYKPSSWYCTFRALITRQHHCLATCGILHTKNGTPLGHSKKSESFCNKSVF